MQLGALIRRLEDEADAARAIEALGDVPLLTADKRETEPRYAEVVVEGDLRYRDKVLTMQTVLDGLHHTPLVLEGLGGVDEKIELEDADDHGLRGDQSDLLTSTCL